MFHIKKKKKNSDFSKKSISPVVAVALLLVVSVVAVVGFQTWFQDYQSNIFSNTEEQSQINNLEILKLVNNKLYLKTSTPTNLTRLKIISSTGKIMCDYNPKSLINQSGLLLWINFDKYNESGVFDASGNGHFGYFHGGLGPKDIVPGIYGKGNGIHLDGKDDYIEILHDEVFDNLSEMTVEVWESYEGTYSYKNYYINNYISNKGFVVLDFGKNVLKVNSSVGEGYIYEKNFTDLDGWIWLYDYSRIGANTGVNTHRIEVYDLTNGSIIGNITLNTNDYDDNLTYKRGFESNKDLLFFGNNTHKYQIKVYYYNLVDLYLDYLYFDLAHRSVITKSGEISGVRYLEWSIYYNLCSLGVFLYYNSTPSYDTVNFELEPEYCNIDTYVYLTGTFNIKKDEMFSFKNGVLQHKKNNLTFIRDYNGNIYIGDKYGENSDSTYFKGKVDEIRIWNRSLREEEVQKTYFQSISNLNPGVNSIDISSCNLNNGEIYNVLVGSENYIIDSKLLNN